MADHLYLPALRRDANLPLPPAPGFFYPVNGRVVEALGQGLETGEEARKKGVGSVPDVWARPLLFYSAIKPKSVHPLREPLLEEWRGLLSLLALVDHFGYRLELEPVPLDDRDGPFARALMELAPRNVWLEKEKSYSWRDVFLLRVEGATVGAFCPLTLVYTGVRALPSTLRLVDNGRLRTPTDAAERRYVLAWVEKLRLRLQEVLFTDDANPDHTLVDEILEQLRTFAESLRRGLGLAAGEAVEERGTEFLVAEFEADRPHFSRLSSHAVFRELLRPLRVDSAGEPSDLLLKAGRGQERVLVVTSQLLCRDVRVWKSLRTKDLGSLDHPQGMIEKFFHAGSGHFVERHNLANEGARWIRPELHFLGDILLATKNEEPLLAEGAVPLPEIGRRCIWPFRKEILDHFAPSELALTLEPKFETIEGGLRFSFVLPLQAGADAKVRIQKDYKLKDPLPGQGTLRFFDPPPAYLFPRYRTRHWRRYFLFSGGRAASLEPVLEKGSTAEEVVRHRGDIEIRQISGEQAFPEALVVRLEDGQGGGLILPAKRPERVGLAGSREMTIGIDYGTSNTNVFLLLPDADQPQPWVLDLDRWLQPIFAVTAPAPQVAEHFLPTGQVRFPAATHLRIYDPTLDEHSLLDYFIHFSEEYRLPDNVHSDIKWQDIAKTQQFIRSLLMLMLLEVSESAARRFKLIFSYPRAFSENQQQRLEQTWESAIRELTEEKGRLLNVARGTDPDVLKPHFVGLERAVEAVAAGEYFASRNSEGKYEKITIQSLHDRAAVDTTAVCIDVGGGTSDICIWHRNQRVLDASVLLAGRQIGAWLRSSGRICELLFSRDAALALKEVEAKPVLFASRLNQILRREEAEIAKNLIMNSTRPEIDRLRVMLVLEFGAILFYTATLLAAANRLEHVGAAIAEDIESGGINIHWGGNAAKMLRWIDYGRFAPDGFAADILRAVLRNGLADAGLRSRPDTVANKESPGHKSEVAGGLIVWDNVKSLHQARHPGQTVDEDLIGDADLVGNPALGGCGKNAEPIYLGDSLETTEGLLRWDEPVRPGQLFPSPGRTIVKAPTLERLDRFLKIVNQLGIKKGLIDEGKEIQLTDALRVLIGRQVRGEFVTMASLDPGKRVLEPVFISEVKSLLEVLGHPA